MRDYEMMVVLSPTLDEAGLEASQERLKTLITNRGGEVVSVEPWGRRRLAYQLKGFREGFYAVIRFKLRPEETDPLDRSLRLTESLIRHLVVQLETV